MEIGEVEALRIDRAIGVAGLAAQANGEELIGIAVASLVVLHGPGNPQVVAAIGHLRELARDDTWTGEGLVDIPQRAGAAVIGKVHAGGGLPLGHIAGAIHAHEGKRNAAQIIALQGGKPGGDRLVSHAEDLA